MTALIWTLFPIFGEFSTTWVLVGGCYTHLQKCKSPDNLPSLGTQNLGHGLVFSPGLGNQTQPPGVLNMELVRQRSSKSEESTQWWERLPQLVLAAARPERAVSVFLDLPLWDDPVWSSGYETHSFCFFLIFQAFFPPTFPVIL